MGVAQKVDAHPEARYSDISSSSLNGEVTKSAVADPAPFVHSQVESAALPTDSQALNVPAIPRASRAPKIRLAIMSSVIVDVTRCHARPNPAAERLANHENPPGLVAKRPAPSAVRRAL